jgi:SAM-dependent methyltransferase
LRSNLAYWKELQEKGYFDNHPCYKDVDLYGFEEAANAIRQFRPLDPKMRVAVIGCGFGRESATLAPHVGHVFGIDVSTTILDKAVDFVAESGVSNFTPVLSECYREDIPEGLDLVFSIVVMQHLTRDLVRDYFSGLGVKLRPGGAFVVQFLEELFEGVAERDAELAPVEPSVSWTTAQIVELSRSGSLTFVEARSFLVTPTALWHWAYFTKPE